MFLDGWTDDAKTIALRLGLGITKCKIIKFKYIKLNAYTQKIGEICSPVIERKQNSDIIQGP